MRVKKTFVILTAILLTAVYPMAGFADDEVKSGDQYKPQYLQGVGLFFEPALMVSGFVTDKGTQWRSLKNVDGFEDPRDLHTGALNWITHPSLAAGYDWGNWQLLFRAAYPFQTLSFDLQADETADGWMASAELATEAYFRFTHSYWSTAAINVGTGVRLFPVGSISHSHDLGEGDIKGYSTLSGYTVNAGMSSDFLIRKKSSFGWFVRFYYVRENLVANLEDNLFFDEERFELDIYSVLVGLRVRIFPSLQQQP